MADSPVIVFASACLIEILSSIAVGMLSYRTLAKIYRYLRTRSFENDGHIYQDIFRVKLWKDYVPAIGAFDKKHIQTMPSKSYMALFLLESIRAELVHIVCITTTLPFLMFSDTAAKKGLILFFLFINIPCIIIQRYNRPRFEHLLSIRGGVEAAFIEMEAEAIRSPGRR